MKYAAGALTADVSVAAYVWDFARFVIVGPFADRAEMAFLKRA